MTTILDLTPQQYRDLPGINAGFIRTFALEGSAAAYASLSRPKSVTPAMRNGTLFHQAMEREDWRHRLIVSSHLEDNEVLANVRESWQSRGNAPLDPGTPIELKWPAHRDYQQRLEQACALDGKSLVSREEIERLEGMVAACRENPAVARYLWAGRPEVAAVTSYGSQNGSFITLKALADALVDDGEILVEYKSSQSATPEWFGKQVRDMGYYYQLAHYVRVFQPAKTVWIVVRTEDPYEAMCYLPSAPRMYEADRANLEILDQIADCYETGSWHTPGWGEEFQLHG